MKPFGVIITSIVLFGLLTSFTVHGGDPAPLQDRASSPVDMERSESLTVAVIQMRSTADLKDNVARIRRFIRAASERGADVVVFPECALSSYNPRELPVNDPGQIARAEQQVIDACKEAGVYAILGTPYHDGSQYYVSATVISPGGEVIERYHKIQLAGERWAVGGDRLSVFMINGIPCSIIICHDNRYPELTRLPVLAGARIIFYISHESGLREERKISPYRAQMKARAVENNVYVVHSNAPANHDASGSHGHSRIISPTGNILQEASIFGEDILIEKLDPNRATRGNALQSLNRGPLRDWWAEGVKRVKIIAE